MKEAVIRLTVRWAGILACLMFAAAMILAMVPYWPNPAPILMSGMFAILSVAAAIIFWVTTMKEAK